MHRAHLVALLVALSALCGCNPAQDWDDARVVANRVHSQLSAGDHAGIYKEAAPRFKTVGTESQFVALMRQLTHEHGFLKDARELGYESGFDTEAGAVSVLLYDVQFEKSRMRERLMIKRSHTGKMELWKLDIQPTH
jgi:hypothetical protein